MNGLIAGVAGLPLVSGIIVLALRHHPLAARCATLGTIVLTSLCAAALAINLPEESFIIAEWLPGSDPMSLTANPSGLYAALATTAGLGLSLLALPTPPLTNGLMLLALTGANTALMAEHFLLRYVALEIVALCVLLIPLAEKPTPATNRSARDGYLLLRLGDAGLLAAILILWRGGGTLHIDSALETARDLPHWELAAAGLLLAVWVKLGSWPLHVWSGTGSRISLGSQAWLYATVVPNLGLYLLYRVTPLLSHAGSLRIAVLWIGATGALFAALATLAQSEPRSALIHVGAVQGSLSLMVAAAGAKSSVWLTLVALTPLRLLLFAAVGTTQRAKSPAPRRIAAGLTALGGLTLAAFSLVVVGWARDGIPPVAQFVAQTAAALGIIWTIRLSIACPKDDVQAKKHLPPAAEERDWPRVRWTAAGILGSCVLTEGLAFGRLANAAATVTHTATLSTPTLSDLAASLPALLMAGSLWIALELAHLRIGQMADISGADPRAWGLERGLMRVAEKARAVIEAAFLERTLIRVQRAVIGSARVAWVLEHRVLDGVIERSAQALMHGSDATHRILEQHGLEGILRRTVRGITALASQVQRWHTGRLRRNLLWIPIVLAVAIVTLVAAGL